MNSPSFVKHGVVQKDITPCSSSGCLGKAVCVINGRDLCRVCADWIKKTSANISSLPETLSQRIK